MPTKRTFDLIVIVGLGIHLSIGLVRMEARRLAAAGGPIGQTVGQASLVVLGV